LEAMLRRRVDPVRNPFFRRSELVLFFAERQGQVVGSISALRDHAFDPHADERIAWWGFFETIDDPEVSRALFDAVRAKAREWGATGLRGPRNLTRMEDIGLTVHAFDRRPPMMQGHHKPWYPAHVEAAGLVKHHDHYAYETNLFEPDGRPRQLPDNLRSKAEACDIGDLEVRSARWRSLGHDLGAAHDVLTAASVTVPDVAPMPRSTWMALGRSYLMFTSRELLQLAFVKGEPVAYAACFPEINNAMAAAGGALLPLGWLRFLRAVRRETTAGFKLIGVVPEYRGRGLHAVLIKNIIEGLQRAGYQRVDGSIVDERNLPMRRTLEHAGLEIWRTYRIYEASLDD
ncbi:MAG: GNAT family N-acetyltransferase, partial [Myxococcota bacterium]